MARSSSSRRRSRRRKRRLVAVAAAAVLLGVVAGLLWVMLRGPSGPRTGAVARHVSVPSWITPGTLVATVSQPTPGYASPATGAPSVIVPPSWAGTPSSLPVLASLPGWVEVSILTPPSPAAPIAWIPAASASLTRTPYRVVVDVSRTRLLVFRDAKLVVCAPAAVGAAQTPTPLGHYFVALFARPPSPAYGEFVLVTSSGANTITDWQQSGHSVITIHGPLDSAAAIGTTGAPVTTGSIRMLDPDLQQLRGVPTGSPIDVVTALTLPPPARDRRHPLRQSLRACAT